MDTISWHMNATQGGANCAHEHGLSIRTLFLGHRAVRLQTSPQKPLAQSKPNSCGASLGRGTKVYINGPGHMTKMAAMQIY